MEQSNRYTFYHETESHSGRRRCVTPIWNLAEFNYVVMFGGELTESLGRWFFRNSVPNSISRTFQETIDRVFRNRQSWVKLLNANLISDKPFSCQNAVLAYYRS